MLKDSVGNTYTKLPPKKENPSAKGAKPGPKHGDKGHQARNCQKYAATHGGAGKKVPQHPNARGKEMNMKGPHVV